jgi:ArsR family transcriptional regulator
LIIDVLAGGEQCVSDLTQRVGSDPSTVSSHLSVLRNVGLVIDEKRGQQVFYRLAMPCVTKIFQCLEEICSGRDPLR